MTTSTPLPGARQTGLLSGYGAAGLAVGVLSAIQARVNGEFAAQAGEPLIGTLWNFGSGFVVLCVALLLMPPARAGLRAIGRTVRGGTLSALMLTGGLWGSAFVFTQSFAVPHLGVAMFTIGVVTGQATGGIVVDRLGIGPGGRRPLTALRVAAAVTAVVGVIIAVSGRLAASSLSVGIVLIAVAGGLCLAMQAAVNGRVNLASGSHWATTWVVFGVGLVIVAVVSLTRFALSPAGLPDLSGLHDAPLWAWFGGVGGVVFVGSTAIVVRHLGVLQTMLAQLAGQLAGAITLDLLNPSTRHTVTALVLLGLAVTAAGATLPALAALRGPRPNAPPGKP